MLSPKSRRDGRLCPPKGRYEFAEVLRVSEAYFAGRAESPAPTSFKRACLNMGKDGLAALFLTLHVSGSAAAVVTPAAAAVAVTVPEYEDNDQNNDPPPAVAEGADTGRIIARHNETS